MKLFHTWDSTPWNIVREPANGENILDIVQYGPGPIEWRLRFLAGPVPHSNEFERNREVLLPKKKLVVGLVPSVVFRIPPTPCAGWFPSPTFPKAPDGVNLVNEDFAKPNRSCRGLRDDDGVAAAAAAGSARGAGSAPGTAAERRFAIPSGPIPTASARFLP